MKTMMNENSFSSKREIPKEIKEIFKHFLKCRNKYGEILKKQSFLMLFVYFETEVFKSCKFTNLKNKDKNVLWKSILGNWNRFQINKQKRLRYSHSQVVNSKNSVNLKPFIEFEVRLRHNIAHNFEFEWESVINWKIKHPQKNLFPINWKDLSWRIDSWNKALPIIKEIYNGVIQETINNKKEKQ